jgi:hypothetical protein
MSGHQVCYSNLHRDPNRAHLVGAVGAKDYMVSLIRRWPPISTLVCTGHFDG